MPAVLFSGLKPSGSTKAICAEVEILITASVSVFSKVDLTLHCRSPMAAETGVSVGMSNQSLGRRPASSVALTTLGGRLLQTYTLIGQELQLSSCDWTRATKLDLLSNQSVCLYNRLPLLFSHQRKRYVE